MSNRLARACVLDRPHGEFQIREYPIPEPAPGTALLRQELAGVCASDVHVYHGRWPGFQYPVILGHENVGIIERLGAGLRTDYLGQPVAEGDRVIPRSSSCGRCYYCLVAQTPRKCENRKVAYGITSVADREPFLGGGFGEYLYLSSPETTALFKTTLGPETAVLLEPFGVAIAAVRRTGVRLGDTVVVQGSGAIGLFALVAAKLSGAVNTIVVGGPEGRLRLAREFGADWTIDISAVPDPAERLRLVKSNTPRGLGADVVFGCVGKPSAVVEGIGYLRDGAGKMCEVGSATDAGEFTFNPHGHLVDKNATLIGSLRTSTEDWVVGLRILEKRELPFAKMVTHRLPLERVGEAISALDTGYSLDGLEVAKIAIEPNHP